MPGAVVPGAVVLGAVVLGAVLAALVLTSPVTARRGTSPEPVGRVAAAGPVAAGVLAPTPLPAPRVGRTAPTPGRVRPSPGAPLVAGRAEPRVQDPASTGGAPAVGSSLAEGVDAMLARRAAAVAAGDADQWDSTVAAGRGAAHQRELFAAVSHLPVERWTYDPVTVPGDGGPRRRAAADAAALPPTARLVRTVLRYRLAGYDRSDVLREQWLTVVPGPGGWRVAADDTVASYTSPRDLWDLGPVSVVQGRASLVVGRGGPGGLQRYADEADRAVAEVTQVWGDGWQRRVVVLVPADRAELGAVLQTDGSGYGQIAALTTGEVEPGSGRTAGDRIVINEATFPTLSETGRQIVLGHETTHVAARAETTGLLPLWIVEGSADYVGFRSSGVPVTTGAADVLDRVRAGRGPTALPSDAAFDGADPDLGAAYEAAWLACRLIATRYGPDALVRFYRDAADGGGVGAAFARLGTDQATFTRSWRGLLAQEAALP